MRTDNSLRKIYIDDWVISGMGLSEIVHRSNADTDFVDAIRSNPEAALAEYDVSDEVLKAIKSGDEMRIRAVFGQEMEAGIPNAPSPERV